jgi:hypothetical protein
MQKISGAILAMMLISVFPMGGVSANSNTMIQGDEANSTGPATTLCTHSNPDNCSEDHFDSGSSVHIGEHDNTEETPWAYYEVTLNSPQMCIGDMSVEMHYQVNDVFHRSGIYSDHDVFVKLKDFSSGEHHLLDSTVDTSTSNGGGDYEFHGTLDFGARQGNSGTSEYHQWGHNTGFVQDSTRTFTHGTIPGTSQQGDYLRSAGNQHSEIGLYITANPEEDPQSWYHHTRVEVDWIKVHFDDEQIAPENPSDPSFYWQDQSMWPSPDQPGGPTATGWYNSLSSLLMVNFGSGGYDACGFHSLEYLWKGASASPPSHSTAGAEIFPDDWTNSGFSDIVAPSNSGSYKFWYRAIDDLGNKATWQSGDSIDFDYTNPQLPSIDADPTWYSGDNPPTLAWDAASDSYSGVSDYQIIQDGIGAIGEVAHVAGEGQYAFEVDPSTLVTGSNQFEIAARDHTQPSRNTHSQTVGILFDDIPPTVTPPIEEGKIYLISNPPVEWTHQLAFEDDFIESGIDHCFLTIDSVEVSHIPGSECKSSSGSVDLPYLGDGPHTLTITACDRAGNCEGDQVRNFTVDATLPKLSDDPITRSGWVADSSITISANFSDVSEWGIGSGIDRVWHGFYPAGTIPTESEIKNDNSPPSVCLGEECMTHEVVKNIDVSDGSWVWWFLVKDQSGNEHMGHSPTQTMIDMTSPTFIDGPQLVVGPNGEFVATWEADDGEGSGLNEGGGYFFEIDSCNFTGQTPTTATTTSFSPSSDSHYICVKAMDKAGNEVIAMMDTNDPLIVCDSLSEGDVFQEFPTEVTCTISDDSEIDLHVGLGSVERILIDGEDITIDYSFTSNEMEFKILVPPQGIGWHALEIDVLDRFGRESGPFNVQYFVSGYGVEVTYWSTQGWTVLPPESDNVLSFHWDKEDLGSFMRGEWEITGVDVGSLDGSSLGPYFHVTPHTSGDDPLNHLVRLDPKMTLEPSIGESVSLSFSVDDGFSLVDYHVTVAVDPCPPDYFHNLSVDLCEQIAPTDEQEDSSGHVFGIVSTDIVIVLLLSLSVLGATIIAYRSGTKGPAFASGGVLDVDEFEDFTFEEEE